MRERGEGTYTFKRDVCKKLGGAFISCTAELGELGRGGADYDETWVGEVVSVIWIFFMRGVIRLLVSWEEVQVRTASSSNSPSMFFHPPFLLTLPLLRSPHHPRSPK